MVDQVDVSDGTLETLQKATNDVRVPEFGRASRCIRLVGTVRVGGRSLLKGAAG